MLTQKMKEQKTDSKMSNTYSQKTNNILSKYDIYDNKKYNITKINTKINNNPFNIILLDKKINKNYIKKESFSNLNVENLLTTENNNDYENNNKEIKSENIDESCEKLHYRINSLLISKNRIKRISPDDIKLDFTTENLNNQNNKYNRDFKEKDLSQNMLNENIKVNSINNKNNEKENNKISELKIRISRSFTSLPIKLEKEIDLINNYNGRKLVKQKSIISQDNQNKKNSLFSSINDLLNSVNDNNINKEYNFDKKENKKYKNIQEIKDDQNYFRLLYLSSNLIEILKKKNKYQIKESEYNKEILKKEQEKENIISDLNNENYYIYTNDRNVLKLTALFFQKVQKAIYLFNTGKYENAYKSLIEDKIIKNRNMFALFLLTIQGIDKEKIYQFLSQNKGINKNFVILKYFLSFFDFSYQTIIVSFNFLLETISIPSNNNDNVISLFAEAFIKDNRDVVKKNLEIGKNEIKNICGLILKLNNIMNDPEPDEIKIKNKNDFINSRINDTTNWNPDLNHLISNDPSTTVGLLNYSHVCGYIYDEYIKNENSISQQKKNHRAYNELLYKRLLVNKSFSFQNSLIKNELNNINSESNLVDDRQIKKKKISIISNKKILYKPSKFRKNSNIFENKIKISNEGKEDQDNLDENDINSTIKLMKKGEKFYKIININGKASRIVICLTQDENNLLLSKDLCCEGKEIILIDDISECTIGYSQNIKTNKSFENYMTILLKTEQIFEFYHPDKKMIEKWVKSLDYLIQKRNKVLDMLSQKEKISEEKISIIWETDFLCNWSYYRRFIIKKKNNKIEGNINLVSNNNNNHDKILKIWSLGLPFWLRANMWKLVILNELNITEILFQGYFQLVTKEQEKYNIMNKKKQNVSINFNNTEILEENYDIIEIISKDCKKIINRIKNILTDIHDKLAFINEAYKIIRSFCLYRPDLIYNKNISELAIFFYINCNLNGYDTFVILCNFIINNYFFKHIQNDRLFMKNQLKFFEKLIEKYLPSIHTHFEELQFNINIFFYKWIEYLFLRTFNYKICLRIFDNFILKGEIFIFEVSIATLYLLRKEILNSDESDLVYLLKKKEININEDALFEYIESIDIKKEFNDYLNIYILGKEKIELLQDL